MSNLLGPRDANGIPVPMTVDESIASMKASLLKKIKRSAYVYRVDCGGCNGCEIEIFATLSPLFDAERFGIKVVPSPRHADILLFTGAVTRAMRSPALRAWQFDAWQFPTLAWGDPTLPSALRRFTSEFGMGSGGTTALEPDRAGGPAAPA